MGGTTLLIGDTHERLPDFSSLKKYVTDVHLVVSLGDHVSEYIPYSSRRLFLERLSESFRELSPRVMVVEGNHDRKCSHYEKKGSEMKPREISDLRAERELTPGNTALSMIDEIPENIRFTEDLLRDMGIMENYACLTGDGKFIPGSKFDPELVGKEYEVYVSKPSAVPESVLSDENVTRLHLLSHHQNLKRFSKTYWDYSHGHSHQKYKNGEQISSSVIRASGNVGWRIDASFSYQFEDGKLDDSLRHTPCISFFVGDDKAARLEIVPGIYGDWMLLDSKGRRVIYGSSITKKATEISVDELFEKVSDRAGLSGYTLLM